MAGCCEDKACEIERPQRRQTRTLRVILAINAVMFFVEAAAGLAALFLHTSFGVIGRSLAALRAGQALPRV